ncbi:MAG: NAD(P)/FAD-dependent oxidoreductase [Aquificae bacterium]|nr:NAD(P)/FAD-dependent oxidoreductase [Aquificota bacterium]
MRWDVVIVGGGPAGLSCALTLASAQGRGWEWVDGRRFLVVDEGESDLKKALLNNAPGVPLGTKGAELLEQLRRQVKALSEAVEIKQGKVVKVEGSRGSFKVYEEDGTLHEAEVVVLATGFQKFELECPDCKVKENPKSPKPGRVMVEHDGDYRVKDGLFVAGLLAGVSSMFATAAGSGVQVAVNILSEWAGKPVVVHDVPEKT